jgi:hypothetical protein
MVAVMTLVAALISTTARAQRRVDDSNAFFGFQKPCETLQSLPELTGPNQVGVSTFFWVDEQRPETATSDPNDFRQIIVQLFYPAIRDRSVPPLAYVPELSQMRAGLSVDTRQEVRKIGQDLERFRCVTTQAFADLRVSGVQKSYPILIFSPGGNMSRHWHTAQAEEWASHGYVVAVLSHAYSGMDVFPSGGMLMSSDVWRASKGATPEEEARLDDALSDGLAGDARFALSRIEQIQSGAIPHPLNGHIDLGKAALLGHSRGGKTVGRACADDTRFKACVTFDNIAPARERKTGIHTPHLVIRTPWAALREKELDQYLALNPAGAFDIALTAANHFTFSDLTLIDPEHYPSQGDAKKLWALSNTLTLSFLEATLNGKAFPIETLKREHTNLAVKAYPPRDEGSHPRISHSSWRQWRPAARRTPPTDFSVFGIAQPAEDLTPNGVPLRERQPSGKPLNVSGTVVPTAFD